MEKKPSRKMLAQLLLVGTVAFGTLVGCNSNSGEVDGQTSEGGNDDLIVIKYGSHEGNRENPHYVDPVTGEFAMGEEREMRLEALEVVKEELGVDLQFVQYPGDVEEVLLQSVMANDPIADIVRIPSGSQGTILGQNILLDVSDHVEHITEPVPEIYGGQYFIRVRGNNVHPLYPLMYNVNYIEAVPGLKVDGETVFPSDLYNMGEWTWSNFKEYLQVIDDYYETTKGPVRPEYNIQAYHADYREVGLLAIASAGGSIYGADGLAIDSQGTIDGVNFVDELMSEDLLTVTMKDDGTSNPNTDAHIVAFGNGEAVFTQYQDWRHDTPVAALGTRGESVGFIPFPRPDHMEFDDPNYRQSRTGGESYGILKGIDDDKVALAIQAYYLYDSTVNELYLERYGTPKVDIVLNFDRMHPEVGPDMAQIYEESLAKTTVNELSNMVGVYGQFLRLMGDSLFGINGTAEFETAVASEKAAFEKVIADTEAVLASGETKDNVGPNITQVTPKTYAFPMGTDLSTIDFKADMAVVDNVDGELDNSIIEVDVTATDTSKPGKYWPGLVVTAKDSLGNEGQSGFDIIIYDADNKEAPTLTLKEEYRNIALNEDVSKINWRGEFVDQAVDATGVQLAEITADVAQLDTTTAGEYTVKLTGTDFAGNTTEVEVAIVVE